MWVHSRKNRRIHRKKCNGRIQRNLDIQGFSEYAEDMKSALIELLGRGSRVRVTPDAPYETNKVPTSVGAFFVLWVHCQNRRTGRTNGRFQGQKFCHWYSSRTPKTKLNSIKFVRYSTGTNSEGQKMLVLKSVGSYAIAVNYFLIALQTRHLR